MHDYVLKYVEFLNVGTVLFIEVSFRISGAVD